MNQRAEALAQLLASLARVVEALDDEKLNALLAGNFRLEIAGEEVKLKAKGPKDARQPRTVSLPDNLIDRLRDSSSMAEGERLLQGLDKAALRAVAHHVHVRPNRKDDVEALIGKIVRQTIGQRVSREAIRGSAGAVPIAIPNQPEDSLTELPSDKVQSTDDS